MNYLQFCSFLVYGCAVFVAGIYVYLLINRSNDSYLNEAVRFAETFLLGSILVIGELLFLSLVGLYKTPFLWGAVLLNFLFILNKGTRSYLGALFGRKLSLRLPHVILFILMAMFAFRNFYFLVTGDSHVIYLFAQKLWLSEGTSLLGHEGLNIGIFTPHFNAVPYVLGISLFGQEVLFPQMVNLSWRLIAILLVFGYTSYRFNGYFGLIAAGFVMFDEHIFYSGASACVIINGAVVAFLFASIYNFWESKRQNNQFRLLLALIFLFQLMGNKYQMAYIFGLVLVGGLSVQPNLILNLKSIIRNKQRLIVLTGAVLVTSFWYVKNFLVTGCPTFPVLADKFGALNWTPEMVSIFSKAFGSIDINIYFKYLSYFFVWPGILPAKMLILFISFLPVIFAITAMRDNLEKESVLELCYWLAACFFLMTGICLIAFVDPRAYRYLIGVMSYAAVLSVIYALERCLNIKKEHLFGVLGIVLCFLFLALSYSHKKSSICKLSTVQENLLVLTNRLHMKDLIPRYYPESIIANKGFYQNEKKAEKAAWDIGVGGTRPHSAFLDPVRPQVGLWATTVIKWDSYADEKLIVKDLKDFGIESIMRVEKDSLRFLTLEEYAKEAVTYDRFPKEKFYNYSFPEEVARIR